jgi:hypothetical protein
MENAEGAYPPREGLDRDRAPSRLAGRLEGVGGRASSWSNRSFISALDSTPVPIFWSWVLGEGASSSRGFSALSVSSSAGVDVRRPTKGSPAACSAAACMSEKGVRLAQK